MPFIRFVELAPGRRPGPIPVFQVHIFLLSPEPADSVFSAVWSLPAASSSAPVLGSDQTATRQRGCLCPLNRGNLMGSTRTRPDNSTIITGRSSGELKFWDVESCEIKTKRSISVAMSTPFALAVSPDGNLLAA